MRSWWNTVEIVLFEISNSMKPYPSVVRACDRFFRADKSRWGFQPHSANLSWQLSGRPSLSAPWCRWGPRCGDGTPAVVELCVYVCLHVIANLCVLVVLLFGELCSSGEGLRTWRGCRGHTGVCEKNVPFAQALALQSRSINGSPATDLVLSKLTFQCVSFSGGVLFSKKPVPSWFRRLPGRL